MAYNTIKLTKHLDVIAEYTATAVALTPGTLIELGSAGTVQAHSTQGGSVLPMFVLEDELQGKGIDDNIAASNKIQCWIPTRGDIVYAILQDGENVAIGDFLSSNGTGTLIKLDVAASGGAEPVNNTIVGIALEAVDLSDSSGGESSGALAYNKRIKVRII